MIVCSTKAQQQPCSYDDDGKPPSMKKNEVVSPKSQDAASGGGGGGGDKESNSSKNQQSLYSIAAALDEETLLPANSSSLGLLTPVSSDSVDEDQLSLLEHHDLTPLTSSLETQSLSRYSTPQNSQSSLSSSSSGSPSFGNFIFVYNQNPSISSAKISNFYRPGAMCDNQLSSASPNIVAGANGLVLNGSANNSPAATPTNLGNAQGNAHNFQSILQSQLSSAPLNSVGNALGLSTQQLQQQFHNQNFGGGGMMEHHHQSQQQQQGLLAQQQVHQIQQHSFSGLQHHNLFDNQSQQHSSHHNTLSQQMHQIRGAANQQFSSGGGGVGGSSFNSHHLQQQQQQSNNMGFGGLHGMNTNNNLGMGNVGNNAFNSSPPAAAAAAAALNHYYNQQTHHHNNSNNGGMASNQQQSGGFILPHSNISSCNHSFPHQQPMQPQPTRNMNSSTVPWMGSTATNSPAALIPQNNPSCFNTFTQNNGSPICLPARPQILPAPAPAPQRIPAVPPRVYHQLNTDPNALPGGLEILWRELPPDCKKLMAPQDVPDAAKFRGYFTVCELISLKRQLLARYETVPQRLRTTPILISNGVTKPNIIPAENNGCSSSTAAKEVVKKGTKRGRKEPKVAAAVAPAPAVNEKTTSSKAKGKSSKKARKESEQQQQQQALQQPSQSQENGKTDVALACKPKPEIKISSPEIQEIENEANNESLDGEMMIDLNGLKRDDDEVQVSNGVPPAINEVEVSGAGGGKNDAMIARVFSSQQRQEGEPEETQQNVIPSPGGGGTSGGKTIVSSSNGKSINNYDDGGKVEEANDPVANNTVSGIEGTTSINSMNKTSSQNGQDFDDSGINMDSSTTHEDSSMISLEEAEEKRRQAQAQETLTLFAAAATSTASNDDSSSLPIPLPYYGPSQMQLRGGLAGGPLHQPGFRTLTLVLKMLKIGTFNIRSFSSINPNRIKIVFSTQRITYECQLPTIYQDNNRTGPQPTRKVLMMEYGFDQIQSLHFKSDALYVKVCGTPALSISFVPAPDEEVLSPSSVSQEDQFFLEHVEKGSLRVTPYHEIHVLNERVLQLLQSQMREFPKLRNIFI